MKKVLATGLLAICAIAVVQQEASAWVNTRFGMGLNWEYQSGGNSALWGLWRNGQPPPPPMHGHHPEFAAPMYAPPSYLPPASTPPSYAPPAYIPPTSTPPSYLPPSPLPNSFDVPPSTYPSQAQQRPYGPPTQFATYPRYPRPAYYYYSR